MNLYEVSVNPKEIVPDPNQVARQIGFDNGSVPGPLFDIILNEIDFIRHCPELQGGYRLSGSMNLHPDAGFFTFDGITFRAGKQVLAELKNSEQLALFLCTAGREISSRPASLAKLGHLLDGYVAGVTGTLLLERGMNVLHRKLSKEAAECGYGVTNRYGPGGRNWILTDQHRLFRFFPRDFCGIRLNKSGMMTPGKSVSGVIGMGSDVTFRRYLCVECDDPGCMYENRKPQRESGYIFS